MRPSRLWKLIPATMVGLLASSGPAAAQVAPAYLLTDLTPATGTESTAYGVNAAGVAVGYSGAPGGTHQATLWAPGTGVGTLLTNPAGTVFSEARANNATGQVVGFASTGISGGNPTGDQATLWTTPATPTILGISAAPSISTVTGPSLTFSRAEAISPTGEIVGHAYSTTFATLGAAGDGIRGFYRSAAGVVTRLDPTTTLANYTNDAALTADNHPVLGASSLAVCGWARWRLGHSVDCPTCRGGRGSAHTMAIPHTALPAASDGGSTVWPWATQS